MTGGGGGLIGVVLAGGPGSRMGGGKPMRKIAGVSLIDHVLDSLSQVCERMVISTKNPVEFAHYPLPVIRDRWPDQGPLAAIASVFMDTDADALLITAVDLPLVRPGVLRLLTKGDPNDRARAILGPRWPEPLLSYMHRKCLPYALQLLNRGDRRPRILLKLVDAHLITPDEWKEEDAGGISLFNVNYPDDLKKAEEMGRASGLFDTA